MCRAGGRRCPSSKNPTKEQKDKINARRRKLYNLKKNDKEQNNVCDSETVIPIKDINSYPITEKTVKKVLTTQHKEGFNDGDYVAIKYTLDLVTQRTKEFSMIIDSIKNPDHKNAIHDYTGGEYYEDLNCELRKHGSVDHLRDENNENYKAQCGFVKSEELVRLTDQLDNTIEENSDGKERIVFRGISVDNDNAVFDLKQGDTIDFASFSSATTDVSIANGFSNGVVFEMKTNRGMYISGGETEVILPRNTRWTVVNSRKAMYRAPHQNYKKEITVIQLIDDELFS